jgi:4-alpha-glucanotransferase
MRGDGFFGVLVGIQRQLFGARSVWRRISAVRARRSSGLLLHPTSLPGGRLGTDAYRFVDWLASAGQSWWQILPLGPPDEHGSPYASESAFACWSGLLAEPEAPVAADELESFVARHPFWIGDWAAFAGGGAVADQVRFEREWSALRAYAATRGVSLIGDVPIYVAPGSADHVAHPELFQHGLVAGAPPDDWSATGQLWGNPIYDWRTLHGTGYRWWVERFRRTFELVDVARVDHFRGFAAYWAVPARNRTALSGSWRRGPGRQLFDTVRGRLGRLPLIAEDLGVITPAVVRLREELGLPGMAVLHFLLADDKDPLRVAENSVAYTGTHDNDTSRGWWDRIDESIRRRACRAAERARIEEDDPSWLLIRLALAARSRLAIVPAQDVLGLGNEARMNTPGREEGNWSWRLEEGQLDAALAGRLRAATEAAGRLS